MVRARLLLVLGIISATCLLPANSAFGKDAGSSSAAVFFTRTPSGQFAVQCWVKFSAIYGVSQLNCRNALGNSILMGAPLRPRGFKSFDPAILPKVNGKFLPAGSTWSRARIDCVVDRYLLRCFEERALNNGFIMARSSYTLT